MPRLRPPQPRRHGIAPRMAAEESSHLTALSEWLQLMLAEIARKREDLERARAEEAQRLTESEARDSAPSREQLRI